MVDAMLGSLARKLRAFGFDAAYYKAGDDGGLLRLSLSEGRIILTADRSLAARADSQGIRAIIPVGNSDRERLGSLSRGATAIGVSLVRGDPLCSLCGGELQAVKGSEISGKVPSSVRRRHLLFFQCASCGHIYWRGSHWKRLMSLARRLDQK
ncbi:MAG TPA: Mut7-C RNAse domain-containing protein [Nitrososphaerales archaeon]|nr:Mut7-C RNAse domain-containing protein [Nitrososphaerales archaeon]